MKKLLVFLVAMVICSSCLVIDGLAESEMGNLILPSLPVEVSYYILDTLYAKATINNISYTTNYSKYSNSVSFDLTITGTITYSKNTNGSMFIELKAYDTEGYAVDSTSSLVSNIEEGERFKTTAFVGSLTPGTYSLKFVNASQSSAPTPVPTPNPTIAPTPQPTGTPLPTAKPEYKINTVSYNGKAVTGVLTHTSGTAEANNLKVRVTFFITGNYYMATAGLVESDGSFEVEGVGPIEYISIIAIENNKDGGRTTYDAAELFIN